MKSKSKNPAVYIIAEAGVNHNGRVSIAKRLIDAAKEAGADAVKFQTFQAERVISRFAPKAKYQQETTGKTQSQLEMVRKLELSQSEFRDLSRYCRRKGITFLSTPFDSDSAGFLNRLNIPFFKISSGELTNLPFLREVAKFMKPIILSTGMSNLNEVARAVQAITATGNKKLTLLHCTSNYPAAMEDVNLTAMLTLQKTFRFPVGYSDHTLGIEVAIAAAAMGACVIEKHFTLDKGMAGPDHRASLSPQELKKMVRAIRNIEKAFGNGKKVPCKAENEIRKVARRSVVAAQDIPKGTKISTGMLTLKRPGTGIDPKHFLRLVNRIAKKNIKKDEVLLWDRHIL